MCRKPWINGCKSSQATWESLFSRRTSKEETMSSAQERAKELAREMKKAIMEAKTAEARAKRLGEEVMLALAEARSEIRATSEIVEYPIGRYECKRCGQGSIFSQTYRVLPPCDNCGSLEYVGAEP